MGSIKLTRTLHTFKFAKTIIIFLAHFAILTRPFVSVSLFTIAENFGTDSRMYIPLETECVMSQN